jgi:hypothetical protein
MYVEASTIVYLAAIFPIITGPYAVRQRRKLHRLPTLREELNKLRCRVNELSKENKELQVLQNKVETQVSRLDRAEQKLRLIAQRQRIDIFTLNDLVAENGQLIRQMRVLQECALMGEIMKAIVNSDRSRDFHIDDHEIDMLILKLRGIRGVHLDETELRYRFRSSQTKSIKTFADITKELLQEDQIQLARNVGHDYACMQ